MFYTINSKMNRQHIYCSIRHQVVSTLKFLESSQTKIQNSSIAILKNASFPNFPDPGKWHYQLLQLSKTRRGHSFSTYAQRGEGVKQKRTPCVQGGAYTWKYVSKNVPFLHVFFDIFICWKLLPCFVVIGVDFHYRFIKDLL